MYEASISIKEVRSKVKKAYAAQQKCTPLWVDGRHYVSQFALLRR
jgi:hypothetical protein